MTPVEIITLVSCVLGMCVTVGSLIRPIVNLNTSITKLNDAVVALQGDMMSYKNDARMFSVAIGEITNKQAVVDEQIKSIKRRLDDLERSKQ